MDAETRSQFWPIKTSLRAKVTLGVVLPLVLILGTFTAFEYSRHKEVVLDNLSQLASYTGQVIEDNLRVAMLVSDFSRVQGILDSIGEREEIKAVYLLDRSGKIIFSPDQESVATRLNNQQADCQPCHRLPPQDRPNSIVVQDSKGEWVFRSMRPIENGPQCVQCHEPQQRIIGLLLTDISVAPFEESLTAYLRENAFWLVGTLLVTVLIVNLAMSRFVIRRLEGVARALANFGRGKLDLRLSTDSDDEIGQLASAFNVMGQRIQSEEAENRDLSENLRHHVARQRELLQRLITAQEDERKRVARELHDELGQALAGLSFQVKILENSIESDGQNTLEQLSQIRSLIAQTTERMYDLIMALRPSSLDDLGLVAALNAHADRLLPGGAISFELEARGMSKRLPPNLETALYRIFQEALSNIMRHANAKKIHVKLVRNSSAFEGEIKDDGKGFIPEEVHMDGNSSRGLGLLGMQERVTQLGGQLEIISKPGIGTSIHIRIPLNDL